MWLLALILFSAKPDLTVADFESGYGSWQATGAAFGAEPAKGTLANQMTVTGYRGAGLVSSFHGGDEPTGTLTSAPFLLSHRYLSFLIGGGRDPARLRLELLVDGKAVQSATGINRRPGGSEVLMPDGWDLRPFAGKTAILRIVDEASGGWGHITVDHIVLTDRKPPMSQTNVSRELRLDHQYLHIPVKNGAPFRRLTVQLDDLPAAGNDVELADGEPDWWATLDVGHWRGKRVRLQVDLAPGGSRALAQVHTSDTFPGAIAPYAETGRGQFHFSARRGWLNDPNGLVFYRGEYHLFFQYNPYGWGSENKHWGHAVSKDLVHWQELPIAIYPDAFGDVWSGSAVVDVGNTSGLGPSALALFYTAAGESFSQRLVYSANGREFTKWSGNPAVPEITPGNRDPRVFWHGPTKRWVMALYVERAGAHTIQLLGSKDMKEWAELSRLPGYYECPDMFELPAEGTGESRWVVTAANSDYQVGTFDGTTFRPETQILKGHRGRGFYAAQTFSNLPGRRVQIGWFQTETRGMPFNQAMSIPLELRLVRDADGPRMTWTPVAELRALRARSHHVGPLPLEAGRRTSPSTDADLLEVEISFTPSRDCHLTLTVRGLEIAYDTGTQELIVAGLRAPAPLVSGRQTITVYCDRIGYEIFAAGGRAFLPLATAPRATARGVAATVTTGRADDTQLDVYELRSAWPGAKE